ncbi:MAG: hypothetical protein KC933_25405 [Myxococcales bacterium]|nr:hypothetical protein [Myxococcales bacterium]
MSPTLRITVAVAAVAVVVGAFVRQGEPAPPEASERTTDTMDLSAYSDASPQDGLRLLFIHHSCGGQLFAPAGPEDQGESCIYDEAENGGGLRPMLEAAGYEIHEASYNSKIGHNTDTFDWLPKFRDQLDLVLKLDNQDTFFEDGRENQVIMFKSCYPNNVFVGRGTPPGNPAGPELTVENAKATFRALLPIFAQHPERLFVLVTAPPKVLRREPVGKVLVKRLLGRTTLIDSGPWAREFNTWLVDDARGWLAGYEGKNVVVFDYYDILTGHGRSNFSMYGSGPDHMDDHPRSEGNKLAAQAFLPFLNRAVRRAGLSE